MFFLFTRAQPWLSAPAQRAYRLASSRHKQELLAHPTYRRNSTGVVELSGYGTQQIHGDLHTSGRPLQMKACGFGGLTAGRKDILAMTAAGFGSVQRQFTAVHC